MRYHIINIILYLQGNLDIYNGEHERTIQVWNSIWDEMKYMGLNPESVKDLKRYMMGMNA